MVDSRVRTTKGSLMNKLGLVAMAAALVATAGAAAPKTTAHPQAETEALELAKKAIALRSVAGPNNQTPQVAALYKAALVAGGFADKDIEITPVDDTAYL